MQYKFSKESLHKYFPGILLVVAGIVAVLLITGSFLVINQYSRKYKKIDEQVSDVTQRYLNQHLEQMMNSLPVQNYDTGKSFTITARASLDNETREKMIASIIESLRPELYRNLNFSSEAVRQETMNLLEKEIEEKIIEKLENTDLLTEEQKEIIIQEITIAVETQILNILKEEYEEMTDAITTIEQYIKSNLADMEAKLAEYEAKLKALEEELYALKEKIEQSNVKSKDNIEELRKQLENMESNYASLTNSFFSYINSIKETMDALGLDPNDGSLIERINALQNELQSADQTLLEEINILREELAVTTEELQKQIVNNSDRLEELNQVQNKLQEYADAVKEGDEEARKKLQAELEEYSKGLDEATREHISSVINSTTEDIDEKLAAANQSISHLEKELENNITLLNNRLNNVSDDLQSQIEDSATTLQKQIDNNSQKISDLDAVQKKLQEYADAVKAGDEEARKKLQAELEEYSKGLDEATRQHISSVIDSTTADIDQKLAAANRSIAELETDLTNDITANAADIKKEQTANASDVNAIITELQKLADDAANSTERAKYQAALLQIADKENGAWKPKASVTPTKALSVYNTVIQETKIENKITSVTETIDSTMMKAEFSPDGTTLTITIPDGK